MDVFIETQSGSSFSMKLGYWYTVLEIKQKIEKSQRIPVSKQTLFFKGKVLQDDLDVEECVILHNSRIQLVISPDDNPSPNNAQVTPQTQTTEESSQPSNSIGDILADQDWSLTDEQFRNNQQSWPVTTEEPMDLQDSPAMVGSNQVQYPQFINGQDLPGMVGSYRNNQVFHQTEQSPVPKNSIYGQDWPLTAKEITPVMMGSNRSDQALQTEQHTPSNSTGDIIYGQDWPFTPEETMHIQQYWPVTSAEITPVTVGSNQVVQTEQSPLLNSPQHLIDVQDFPATTWSKKKDQTEQSPPSNPVKKVINIPDSPTKVRRSNMKPPRRLRVMVMPYPETRKIPVEVNAGDHVEELRNELVKIQEKFQLNLPQDGYFFIHKQSVMDEDKSFWWNGVDPGDTIEIFPGTVTRGAY